MEIFSKFTTPGAIFLLTLASGFWLSYAGKPLNAALFNIHKLVALGAVVLAGIEIYKLFKSMDAPTLVILLVVVAGLCVVALFATGALISLEKLDFGLMLAVHRAAMLLLPVALAAALYLIGGMTS